MSSNMKLKLKEEELKEAEKKVNHWRDKYHKMVKEKEHVSMYMHRQLVLHGVW